MSRIIWVFVYISTELLIYEFKNRCSTLCNLRIFDHVCYRLWNVTCSELPFFSTVYPRRTFWSSGILQGTYNHVITLGVRSQSFYVSWPRPYFIWSFIWHWGGAMVSWLVRSPSDWEVWVRVPTEDIVLCFWAKHFTLSVPLSTQVYKWVPANLILEVSLWWTSISSREE